MNLTALLGPGHQGTSFPYRHLFSLLLRLVSFSLPPYPRLTFNPLLPLVLFLHHLFILLILPFFLLSPFILFFVSPLLFSSSISFSSFFSYFFYSSAPLPSRILLILLLLVLLFFFSSFCLFPSYHISSYFLHLLNILFL